MTKKPMIKIEAKHTMFELECICKTNTEALKVIKFIHKSKEEFDRIATKKEIYSYLVKHQSDLLKKNLTYWQRDKFNMIKNVYYRDSKKYKLTVTITKL